jgi:hypothetical protein
MEFPTILLSVCIYATVLTMILWNLLSMYNAHVFYFSFRKSFLKPCLFEDPPCFPCCGLEVLGPCYILPLVTCFHYPHSLSLMMLHQVPWDQEDLTSLFDSANLH